MQNCDHKSVGVIIADHAGRLLLLTRAKPPAGRAPVAGHVDGHGDFARAAGDETMEEAGLIVDRLDLLDSGRLPNICRRPPAGPVHDGHDWRIYRAEVTGAPAFNADETRGGDWYTPGELQRLAGRTVLWGAGEISPVDFAIDPGLEPVWVYWFARLGYLTMTGAELTAMREIYTQPPAA